MLKLCKATLRLLAGLVLIPTVAVVLSVCFLVALFITILKAVCVPPKPVRPYEKYANIEA